MGVCLGGVDRVAVFTSASGISQGSAWPLTPTLNPGHSQAPASQSKPCWGAPCLPLGLWPEPHSWERLQQVSGDVGSGEWRLIV